MPQTFFDDVGEFHKKFDLPRYGDGRPPRLLEADILAFRLGFVAEELAEFCRAHSRGDLAGCLDALVDLTYVVAGTAHLMALPFNEGWAEVQRANMSKVAATGADDPRSKRNHRFDIVKPEGFVPPDHDEALIRAWLAAFGVHPDAVVWFKGKTFAQFVTSSYVRSAMKDAAE